MSFDPVLFEIVGSGLFVIGGLLYTLGLLIRRATRKGRR